MLNGFAGVAGAILADRRLLEDHRAICATGGRYLGTDSELKARKLLAELLAEASGANQVEVETLPYRGWWRGPSSLTLPNGQVFAVSALGRSPATGPDGVEAELVDLGRGIPEDFGHAAAAIKGRFVLVRHEYYMSSGHIHRRVKYLAAKAAGAAGFLIACNVPGGLLTTGSSGEGGPDDIPAAGITYEAGRALAALDPGARIKLKIDSRTGPAEAANLHIEIPGRTPEFVVQSAHIDGHDLAQSAIDNGSGLAIGIAIARAFRDVAPSLRRGLRVSFFNIEEWGVVGSRMHLDAMAPAKRDNLVFNLNLDSVAGHSRLTALTSGNGGVEAHVRKVNAAAGFDIGIHRPMMSNSDHANFVRAGIPAVRLLSGFEEPQSNMRFVLTSGDTADKVDAQELKAAAAATAAILYAALDNDRPPAPRMSKAEVASIVDAQGFTGKA